MGPKVQTDEFIIDLDSPNWRSDPTGTVLGWDSLGAGAAPVSFGAQSGRFRSIEGNWAAVLVDDHSLTLVSDVVRSHALLYARVGSKWVVTDSTKKLRRYFPHWELDTQSAKVFEIMGFALNERTLVRGVSATEAASLVRLPLDGDTAEITFWGVPLYADEGIADPEVFSRSYTAALDAAFTSLLEQTGDRQLVVPLSGGLDSRLIATWLKKLDAPNVLAFTYGREGSAEASIAQTIADSLDIEFVFVPMDVHNVKAKWFAEGADGFREDTWKASALPHIQDWYALTWLKDNELVADDAVFLPGHTPVGMMHNTELLEGTPDGSAVAEALLNHHTLNPAEKPKLEKSAEFRRAIKRAFEQVPAGRRRVQNTVEWFNCRERQAKYINNSMGAYEHFGWSWALPLFWPDPLQTWLSGAEELTAERKWYRDFVDNAYATQTGEPIPQDYFLPPAESSRIPMRDQIVQFSRKTGLNRLISRAWALKVENRHPLALEAFVNADSAPELFVKLAKHRSLMRVWAGQFLENKWGSKTQALVPPKSVAEGGASMRPGDPSALAKPRLLIISYSDIERDARLRKQIDLFTKDYDVTVVGHGNQFPSDAELVLLPSADTKRTEQLRAALLHLKQYGLAQKFEANNLAAKRLLRGRSFDAVITNDIEPVGLAIELFGADKVHADLHEYYPGLQDEDPAWVHLRQPYYRYMLQNYAAEAASATTVSDTIATRYGDEFGFECAVVQNARPDSGLTPTPVHDPIRLVHAGASLPNRNIEHMMRATAASTANVTIDLFLTGQGTAYYDSLCRLAEELGERVRIHPPVMPPELVHTLHQFDVGVHILPPRPTNNLLALPNKFFDFIQARLGLIVGPTPEMQARVKAFDIGAVTRDFTEAALVETIDSLTVEQIRRWKRNASHAATELDVTKLLANWASPVQQIVSRSTGATA